MMTVQHSLKCETIGKVWIVKKFHLLLIEVRNEQGSASERSPKNLLPVIDDFYKLSVESCSIFDGCFVFIRFVLFLSQMVSEESEDDEEKDGLSEDEFKKTEIYMLLMKYAEEKFGPSVN